MTKAFSVVSWNVEHFKGKKVRRVEDVIGELRKLNPDVFAIYEVEGNKVFNELTEKMPKYSFHITEGPQTQEILVGVKSGFTAFFTQKVTFKGGNKYLRPGALLSIKINSNIYTMLFLHTKSGANPLGLGLRDDMFKKACKFRRKLDKAVNKKWGSKYIFLGDLNTMGMKYPFGKGINADTELKKLADKEAKKVEMQMLEKDEPATWWNGSKSKYPPSNLDQVVATNNLNFKNFSGAKVSVLGWPKEPNDGKKDKWIERYSDHGILYFEVLK